MTKHKRTFIDFIDKCYSLQKDRWGHYRFTGHREVEYRIKIMATAWRLELKSGKRWINTVNAAKASYYRDPDAIAQIDSRLKARGLYRVG